MAYQITVRGGRTGGPVPDPVSEDFGVNGATVTNLSTTHAIYYGDESFSDTALANGSIAAGSSATLYGQQYFMVASSSPVVRVVLGVDLLLPSLSAGTGSIDAPTVTARVGNAFFNPALAPRQVPPVRFPSGSRLISSFASGHGWTKRAAGSGSSGTLADDTTFFTRGDRSLKAALGGTGVYTAALSPTLGTTVDLSANLVVCKVAVADWSKLNSLIIGASSDAHATTMFGANIASTVSAIAGNNEWVYVVADPFTDGTAFAGLAAPTWTAINGISVIPKDQNTGTTNFWLQEVWTIPRPANGCIVIAFDDGWMTSYSVAKPYMDKYGLRGHIFPIRDQIGASGGNLYMNISQLRSLHDDSGWEVGVHADQLANHNLPNGLADLSTVDNATSFSDFEAEIVRAKGWLIANRFRGADFFAWPLGKFTAAHVDIARKYFLGIRTFRSTLTSPDMDFYPFVDQAHIRQIAVTGGASPSSSASVITALTAAMTAKKTVILTFHNLATSSSSTDYPVANFQAIMDAIASGGWKVKTLSELFRDGVA